MPELPEVETFARTIAAAMEGRRIDDAWCRGLPYCRESNATVEEALPGCRVLGWRRHGKALFLELSSGSWLYLHFGMSGRPVVVNGDDPSHTRLRMQAEGVVLALQDPRRLGGVGILSSPEDFLSPRKRGPDALSVGREDFIPRLQGRRAVKSALMDQSLVCGVGNLYADEVLFQTGVSPTRRLDQLSDEEKDDIHRWMGESLRRSIEVDTDFSRLPEGMMLRVRGKGMRCPRCEGDWSVSKVGGRTTYHCPSCQH